MSICSRMHPLHVVRSLSLQEPVQLSLNISRPALLDQSLDMTSLDVEQTHGLPQVRAHIPLQHDRDQGVKLGQVSLKLIWACVSVLPDAKHRYILHSRFPPRSHGILAESQSRLGSTRRCSWVGLPGRSR